MKHLPVNIYIYLFQHIFIKNHRMMAWKSDTESKKGITHFVVAKPYAQTLCCEVERCCQTVFKPSFPLYGLTNKPACIIKSAHDNLIQLLLDRLQSGWRNQQALQLSGSLIFKFRVHCESRENWDSIAASVAASLDHITRLPWILATILLECQTYFSNWTDDYSF